MTLVSIGDKLIQIVYHGNLKFLWVLRGGRSDNFVRASSSEYI